MQNPIWLIINKIHNAPSYAIYQSAIAWKIAWLFTGLNCKVTDRGDWDKTFSEIKFNF